MDKREDENWQGYVKIMKKRSELEILKGWLNALKSYDSKIVYFTVLLLGFGLYTLAYVFFYGFYFGKKSENVISILQVVINPVPFNFKSLTMLGLFLVIVCTVFIIILQKITESLTKKSGFIIVDLLVLIILDICAQAAITLVFIGKSNLDLKYFGIWVFINLLIIYFALAASGKLIEIAYGLMVGLLILFITFLVTFTFKLEIRSELYLIIFGIGWFLIAILIVYFNIKKWIINCFIYVVICLLSVEIMAENKLDSFYILPAAIIIMIVQIVINILINKHLYYQHSINEHNFNKKLKTEYNKSENLVVVIFQRYKFILVPISISGIILCTYILIFTLGSDLSKNIMITSYDIISYKSIEKNNETVPMKGIVVAHNDNIFYISNKDRELIMIKKNSDVEISPNKEK